jgi:hypothetical protein
MLRSKYKAPTTLIAVWLLVSLAWTASAQSKRWYQVKSKPMVVFGWECASPSEYPKGKLHNLVEVAVKRVHDPNGVRFDDRAFPFDLNGDNKPEYFIPLDCGATGNCVWGIFTVSPPRQVGIVHGEYFYIHKRASGWSGITGYVHMGACDGELISYEYRRGKYRNYPVIYKTQQLSIAYDFPRPFRQVRTACEGANNPAKQCKGP